MLNLFSEKTYQRLSFYSKTIQKSLDESVLEEALVQIERESVNNKLECHLVRRLLLTGLVAKFPSTSTGKTALEEIKKMNLSPFQSSKIPIVIVAGGCTPEIENQMQAYSGLVLEAFSDYEGIIISGGTTSGISGIVGKLQQKYSNKVQTVGYVPKSKVEFIDKQYSEIRFTDGNNFSPLEILQYWIDILGSGIRVSDVKLLGINGGRLSALEYKIALAFGASVGIIQNSGMEADRILSDGEWNKSANLFRLTKDPKNCYAFIQTE